MCRAPLISLTPARMAVAERQLAALATLGLDADSMMAAFRTVSSYVHGSTQSELALREYKERHGWSSGDETRQALAPQMNYLMDTGRYPAISVTGWARPQGRPHLGVRPRPRLHPRRHRDALGI